MDNKEERSDQQRIPSGRKLKARTGRRIRFLLVPVSLGLISNQLGLVGAKEASLEEEDTDPPFSSNWV